MARTQDEIVARMRADTDMFGFAREVLIASLDFDHAREFLKPDITVDTWPTPTRDDAQALNEMREYMAFAWGKAEDHRGISASRSIEKMGAWLWLLDKPEIEAAYESAGYTNYGAPKLKVICEAFGFQIPDSEPLQRMMRGERCGMDDDCGCG